MYTDPDGMKIAVNGITGSRWVHDYDKDGNWIGMHRVYEYGDFYWENGSDGWGFYRNGQGYAGGEWFITLLANDLSRIMMRMGIT